jgi:hypothetical protein
MERVGIDVDSTLAQTLTYVLKEIEADTGIHIPEEQIRDWNFFEGYGVTFPQFKEAYIRAWRFDWGHIQACEPHLIESLRALKGAHLPVFFLTNQWPEGWSGQNHWLRAHHLFTDGFIGGQTLNKWQFVTTLIDDSPSVGRTMPDGLLYHFYLIDRPWNQDVRLFRNQRRVLSVGEAVWFILGNEGVPSYDDLVYMWKGILGEPGNGDMPGPPQDSVGQTEEGDSLSTAAIL